VGQVGVDNHRKTVGGGGRLPPAPALGHAGARVSTNPGRSSGTSQARDGRRSQPLAPRDFNDVALCNDPKWGVGGGGGGGTIAGPGRSGSMGAGSTIFLDGSPVRRRAGKSRAGGRAVS